jgi:hypothetical protein
VLKVPYALTLEVYGKDGEGQLKQGHANKDLTEFDTEDAAGGGGGDLGKRPSRLLRGSDAMLQRMAAVRRQRGRAGERVLLLGAHHGRGGARGLLEAEPAAAEDEVLRVYSAASRRDQGCFELFNPVGEAEYRDVVGRWVAALLLTLRHLADHQQ